MPDSCILDACCALNLSATGRVDQILRDLPYRFHIGRRARGEALWLSVPGSAERETVDLQPLMDANLLVEEQPSTDEKEALYVTLAASLAGGEAEAAALAIRRGYILATDERKARNRIRRDHPSVRLLTTQELLHEWQHVCGASDAEAAAVIRRISERASYRVYSGAPLVDWWRSLTGAP